MYFYSSYTNLFQTTNNDHTGQITITLTFILVYKC